MKKSKRVQEQGDDLIEELRGYLVIDRHNIDLEIQKQPSLFFKISEAHVLANAHRDHCKEEISRVDADLASKHRRKMEKAGTRATDAAVSAAIAGDPEHQAAVDAHIAARKRADLLASLKEAFGQRSYMLRDLASLYVANYYERSSIDGTDNTKEFKAQKNKDKLAEARKAKKRVRDE